MPLQHLSGLGQSTGVCGPELSFSLWVSVFRQVPTKWAQGQRFACGRCFWRVLSGTAKVRKRGASWAGPSKVSQRAARHLLFAPLHPSSPEQGCNLGRQLPSTMGVPRRGSAVSPQQPPLSGWEPVPAWVPRRDLSCITAASQFGRKMWPDSTLQNVT